MSQLYGERGWRLRTVWEPIVSLLTTGKKKFNVSKAADKNICHYCRDMVINHDNVFLKHLTQGPGLKYWWNKLPTRHGQYQDLGIVTRHQYGNSEPLSQTSQGEITGGVVKRRLFSKASLHGMIFFFFLSILGKPSEVKTWYLDPEKEGELIRRIQQQSCRAFLELDLQDYGLFDFRIDRHGNPFLLECNLFWSSTSLCPFSAVAKSSGVTVESLFDLMVQNALFRKEKKGKEDKELQRFPTVWISTQEAEWPSGWSAGIAHWRLWVKSRP